MEKGTIQLKTERLILRRHCPEDAEILYQNFGTDPEMFKYSGWNPYATKEMAEETVREFIDSYQDEHFYGWAVEHEGRLIGTVGAYDFDPETGSIESADLVLMIMGSLTLTMVRKRLSKSGSVGSSRSRCSVG